MPISKATEKMWSEGTFDELLDGMATSSAG